MAKPVPKTVEEILEHRKSSVAHFSKGDGIIKVAKTPATFKAAGDGKREATFTMSDETADRYGDIVRQNGMKHDDFDNNPIALWMHNHKADPLGTWRDLKVVRSAPKRTEGVLDFAPEGDFEFVDKVARYVELGIYRACSIGFYIVDFEPILDDEKDWTGGFDIVESELIECSVVAVGANANALSKAAETDKPFVIDALEDVLDNWAKTADGLIVPRGQFEEVYGEITGKTISTPALKESALNAEPEEESETLETISVRVDTKDAEEALDRVETRMQRILKGFKELATGIGPREPEEPVYVENSIEELDALIGEADGKLAELDKSAA